MPLAKPARLRPAMSPEAYARDAPGSYVLGRSWLAFCANPPSLSGWAIWGEPAEEDIGRMVVSGEMRWSGLPPHPALIDARGLVRADPFSFSGLATWIGKSRAQLESSIPRLALVHGAGLPGAVAAGFGTVAGLSFPIQAFPDLPGALRWLGRPEEADLLAEVEGLWEEALARPLLRTLTAYLEAHPAATVAEAASAASISTRSLQRRLAEMGTTFQREANTARVRVAQRLLRDSDSTIKRVALEVGCASPQDLSRLFRRILNESPTQWRKREEPK